MKEGCPHRLLKLMHQCWAEASTRPILGKKKCTRVDNVRIRNDINECTKGLYRCCHTVGAVYEKLCVLISYIPSILVGSPSFLLPHHFWTTPSRFPSIGVRTAATVHAVCQNVLETLQPSWHPTSWCSSRSRLPKSTRSTRWSDQRAMRSDQSDHNVRETRWCWSMKNGTSRTWRKFGAKRFAAVVMVFDGFNRIFFLGRNWMCRCIDRQPAKFKCENVPRVAHPRQQLESWGSSLCGVNSSLHLLRGSTQPKTGSKSQSSRHGRRAQRFQYTWLSKSL